MFFFQRNQFDVLVQESGIDGPSL
uniref:Uncharacterized protein n=1 Tax=Arundo donax TaxID=35708 RepID=A0A0A9HPU0_ARUDO